MSVEDLLTIRDEVNVMLSRRAEALRKELASIDGDPGEGSGVPANAKSKLRGRKVEPKYRDPKTGETWSGRGAAARWIAAYEKEGRKRDEFLVKNRQSAPKRRKNKSAKRTRRKK
jgi:DNA-binding protein H-NS